MLPLMNSFLNYKFLTNTAPEFLLDNTDLNLRMRIRNISMHFRLLNRKMNRLHTQIKMALISNGFSVTSLINVLMKKTVNTSFSSPGIASSDFGAGGKGGGTDSGGFSVASC